MIEYSLDSNIVIDYFKEKDYTQEFLLDPNNIAASYVVVGEVYQGALNKAELKKQVYLFEHIEINYGSFFISQLAIKITEEFHLSHGLGFFDALIAATALETDTTLVTLNSKHFSSIKGLKVLNPLE